MSFRDFTPQRNQRRPQPQHRLRPPQDDDYRTPSLQRSSSSAGRPTTPLSLPLCRSKSDSNPLHPHRSQFDHYYQTSPSGRDDDRGGPRGDDATRNGDDDDAVRRSLLVQQREEEYALRTMREREEELRDVRDKMHAVNAIFKELGEVVESQQGAIDEVEETFEQSAERTRRGREQIEKANDRTRRRGWLGGGGDEEEEEERSEGGGTAEGAKQFFLLRYLSRSASEVARIISSCGGAASASYVDREGWNKK